jgi:hypothetical protein
MKLDDVLKKLKKLKKLYEGAKAIKSEGEAANAAAAIQRLLAQYNLSMEEVDKSEKKDEKKNAINEEISSGYTFKSIGGEWEFRLAYVLCKWNFCKCFMYGNSYKRLMIFGKRENLEMVKWLREVLSQRFVDISVERWKEYRKTPEYLNHLPHISKDRFQRGFLMGCAAGLDAKLKEISDADKKQDQEFSTKVTALVVRNNAAIDEFIANKYGGSKSVHRNNKAGTYAATAMGYKTGKETNIHKPISSNQHKNASGVKLLK